VKAAFLRYFAALILPVLMLAGCEGNLAPSTAPDAAYEITGNNGSNHGVIHITDADTGKVEWDAWLDWQDGGQSARSIFHANLTLNEAGQISEATITRHPAETLHLTALADRLHCELHEAEQPAKTFDIPCNSFTLFIPPLPPPPQSGTVLCFDPFSWDYVLIKASPENTETIGLFAGDRRVGRIKIAGDQINEWELPLTAAAQGRMVDFDRETVPAAAVISPTLSAEDMARISSLAVDFDLTLPSTGGWKWAGAGSATISERSSRGEWIISNKPEDTKPVGKSLAGESGEWGVNPAPLIAGVGTVENPQPAAIPSSPLSVLWRGAGDDRSRAWLTATLAQEQGLSARIVGGVVLRPGRDFTPVITQWAEIERDGAAEIADAAVAAGYHLRLWTAPQPLADLNGKVTVKAVQVAKPASWRVIPPATSKLAGQWELDREEAKLGAMTTTWQVNLTGSRPTIAVAYQGDSMNLPLDGTIAVEVDGGGHVWNYLSPELAHSPWLLLALCKGWLLCPAGDGAVAGLVLYFACRDENGWLPPLLWADGQPAEVREAGEGTYSDGRELRHVHRYRVDPPGLLVSVAEGGEVMEVKGEFGTWHRINLPAQTY
jgi:hypothetical protein